MRKTSYAQASQKRQIREKMVEIMTKAGSESSLQDLFAKFSPGIIGKEIEKACHGIYPLKDVFIRKAKVLKKPKFDLARLMDVHTGGVADTGKKVEREEE